MNYREKRKRHLLSNAIEFVLQFSDWDHHPQAPDIHPGIPNYITCRRLGLLERTKVSKTESTKIHLKTILCQN